MFKGGLRPPLVFLGPKRRCWRSLVFTLGRLPMRLQDLSVHGVHHVFGVAKSSGCARWEYLVDAPQIFRSEFHVERRDILFQILAPLGSRDGDDVLILS